MLHAKAERNLRRTQRWQYEIVFAMSLCWGRGELILSTSAFSIRTDSLQNHLVPEHYLG